MTEKTEQKKKTKGCLTWWAIIFVAIIILGVIGGNLNDQEAAQKAQEQQQTVNQPATEQPAEEVALKCESIITDKVGIIYDYTECVQNTTKLWNMSLIISEFTKCSTKFMADYYDKTVKDYDCTPAELVSIKNMDQFYTTYTNCIGGIKTDYTKDMEGAFTEVSQCHANFVTSFNNRLN